MSQEILGTGHVDDREGIAIVGLGCIFPGADSPARFWQNIVDGVDCITGPPPSWRPERYRGSEGDVSEPVYTNRGGYLGDLSRFDPARYGVVPSSLDGAEPDQFLALRCAVDALADAGVPGLPIDRERTGVILGRGTFVNRGQMSWMEHGFVVDQVVDLLRRLEPDRGDDELAAIRRELKRNLPPFNAETMPGLAPCLLTGRIANRLDLKGPTYTLDAACASSLLAVEHAIRELRSGRCSAVIAGGVQITTPAMIHQLFCRIEALSRTGQIAPLSAGADGTLLGEGCGMLVLKRLGDARRDGNRIYAVLREVGVSSDGRGAGVLAPRTEGQQLAIRRAYEADPRLSPASVGLVEAHGTGIALGDQVEMQSLEACFGPRTGPKPTIAVGSVKSMIGHLVPASGAASLIKTSLALYHRTLPPTLHARNGCAATHREGTAFYLSTEARPWVHGDRSTPRRAGVDAFGFGGINAHAVLEEDSSADEPSLGRLDSRWPTELVVVSAADEAALAGRLRGLASWLDRAGDVRLLDIAASCAEEEGNCRVAILATTAEELSRKAGRAAKLLEEPGRARIQDRGGIFWNREPLARSGRVAFVFPGEGAQYPRMLASLCRHFPETRREFDRTDAAFQRLGAAQPLSRLVFPPENEAEAAEAELLGLEGAVVSVTAAERALLALLKRLGIRPDALVGHSSGEFGALLAAGSFDPANEDELVRTIAEGVENAGQVARSGLVPAAVLTAVGGADRGAVERAVAASGGRLSVAMDNCPSQMVLSGDEESTAAALEALRGRGGLCERLAWGRAYHTPAFADASKITEQYIRTLRLGPPRVELWSCATADRFPDDPEAVTGLAVRQWRSPVRFRETIEAMYAAGCRVFIEVGPRSNLSAFISDTLGKAPHAAVPLDNPRRDGLEQLGWAVGMLVAHGVSIDLPALYRARNPRRLDLHAEPPPAEPRQPLLNQALPDLTVSEAVAASWRAASSRPAALIEPAPSPTITTAAPEPEPEPVFLDEDRPFEEGGSFEEDGPVEEVPADPREHVLGDFQRTMRVFLGVQERTAMARFGGGGDGVEATAVEFFVTDEDPEDDLAADPDSSGVVEETEHVPMALPAPALMEAVPPGAGVARLPFLHDVLVHEDDHLVAECELDVDRHRFLNDHTFFGRELSDADPGLEALAVMPLAMTLELLAEAAVALRPGRFVAAVRDIRTMRWLAFETPSRRVRMEAWASDEGDVRVTLYEADREGMSAEVAEAVFELSDDAPELGPAVLADASATPFAWPQDEVYGRILFHGPAFRGIVSVDTLDPHAARAIVYEPDPALISPEDGGLGLVLPAALMDVAGQVAALAVRHDWTDREIQVTFPNRIDRLEFVPDRHRNEVLIAVARIDRQGDQLDSDVEMTGPDGRVVLRALGRSEEVARLPADLYGYWRSPRRARLGQEISALFRDVPGGDRCTVHAIGGGKLLVKRLWGQAVSRMILGADERRAFAERKLPPVSAASWLAGRAAAKEAARAQAGREVCLADVRVEPDEHGRPWVVVPGAEAPPVSLAHKTFAAVAAAGDPALFAGVGIDLEPIGPIDPGVVADAFDESERGLIESAASTAGEPVATWFLSAWGAKEAVGKALGRGVLGGPRALRVVDLDPATRRTRLELLGLMAEAFPEYAPAPGRVTTIDAHTRVSGENIVTLCLLRRGARDEESGQI